MKKLVAVLVLVLIAVYLTLSFLARGDEYMAEKIFYRASLANKKILANPEVAPPMLVESVEKDLTTIIRKYHGTGARKAAHLALAEVYLNNKKYGKALDTLNDILVAYVDDIFVLSQAQFLKGVLYERRNDWNSALREYSILRDRYAKTPLGLEVPIYIGRHYLSKGADEEARIAYNKAARFYKRLEKKYRGAMFGYRAATMLVQTYLDRKQYEEAGNTIVEIIDHYPLQLTLSQQLPTAEIIFVRMLKRPEKAIEIFSKVKEKAKDNRVRKLLQEKIAALEKLNKS